MESITVTRADPQATLRIYYRAPDLVAVEGQLVFDRSLVQVELTWYYEEGWLAVQNLKPGPLDTLHFAAAGLDPLSDPRVGYLTVTYLGSAPGTASIAWHQASYNNPGRTDMMDATTPTDGAITLAGHDGIVWATPLLQVKTGPDGWRQPIKVEIADPDLTEAPFVEAVNVTQGTSVPIPTALQEGVWRGQIPTTQIASDPGLWVGLGNEVQVRYLDVWDAQGQSVRRDVDVVSIPWWGNVSYTGWLTVVDAWMMLRMNFGDLPFDPVGDLTGSGTVTAEDALLLMERLVLLRTRFPIQDGLE